MQSLNPTEPAFGIVVAPGASVTIPVVITPTQKVGTTVSGTVYVDDLTVANGDAGTNELPLNIDEASDVAAVPYTYTVGAPPARGAVAACGKHARAKQKRNCP